MRKNRKENGKRALCRGVKPHSNGLAFSRSNCVLWPTKFPKPNNNITNTTDEIKTEINIIIESPAMGDLPHKKIKNFSSIDYYSKIECKP